MGMPVTQTVQYCHSVLSVPFSQLTLPADTTCNFNSRQLLQFKEVTHQPSTSFLLTIYRLVLHSKLADLLSLALQENHIFPN